MAKFHQNGPGNKESANHVTTVSVDDCLNVIYGLVKTRFVRFLDILQLFCHFSAKTSSMNSSVPVKNNIKLYHI